MAKNPPGNYPQYYVVLSGLLQYGGTAVWMIFLIGAVLDKPFAYNRIVPVEMFNTEKFSLYGLGPVDQREAVLLGNENTLLTAEKTIEYFI